MNVRNDSAWKAAALSAVVTAGICLAGAWIFREQAEAEKARAEKWISNYQNVFSELQQVRAAHTSSFRIQARRGYVFIVTGSVNDPQVVREYVPTDGEIYRELRDALVDKE